MTSSARCQNTDEEENEEKTRWEVVMFSAGQAMESERFLFQNCISQVLENLL